MKLQRHHKHYYKTLSEVLMLYKHVWVMSPNKIVNHLMPKLWTNSPVILRSIELIMIPTAFSHYKNIILDNL